MLALRFEVQPEVAAGTVTADGSGTVPAGPAPLIGDFDGDGMVGWLDVDAFREVFGQCVPPAEPIFDLDNDGGVGFLDLFIFADNFGAENEHPSQ